jgi:plastocyanin
MTDPMRFEPSVINVKTGETIRFVHDQGRSEMYAQPTSRTALRES